MTRGLIGAVECAGGLEDGDGARDFDEMECVDDADAAAFVEAEDGLRVLEVGVHARGGIDEPGAEMLCGVGGVLALAGELPCCGQRGDLNAEADEGFAMGVEVGGIGEAVALDVRAAGVGGVGPPVVALGEIIVRAAGAARAGG